MKFSILLILFSILLNFNIGAEDTYLAIRVSNADDRNSTRIEQQVYNVENGQFVLSHKNAGSYFNSLKDFYIYDFQPDDLYVYTLQSLPFDSYEYLGLGNEHKLNGSGQLILGKTLNQETIEHIRNLSSPILFKGNSLNSNEPITLVYNPQNGTISGSICQTVPSYSSLGGPFMAKLCYLVESSPKTFDGSFLATIYTEREEVDGHNGQRTKRRFYLGNLILNIFGEGENLEIGGAYKTEKVGNMIRVNSSSELVALKNN